MGYARGWPAHLHRGRNHRRKKNLEPIRPIVEEGPTAFLIRQQIEDIPATHLDGLRRVSFREQQYVTSLSAATGQIVEAYGVYNPETQEITMSSNKENIAVIGGGVIYHEAGHHVGMAKLTDAAAAEWNQISENGQHAMISAYARTNQGEHFAEAYRAYVQGGSKRAALRNLEPKSYSFMQSLFRPSGSKKLLPVGQFAKLDWGRYK